MRAALLTEFRQSLEVTTVPDLTPPLGGVVVRVLACGVCRSDWHSWTGSDPDVVLPMVPGHEYCGEIVAVGQGVTRWREGDRVIAPFILGCGSCGDCAAGQQTICDNQIVPGFTCDGAFAEMIAVPFADANLAALPDTLDPAVAAGLGCRVTTVWQALIGRARLQPGEWIAVFGGGGVGLSVLLLGRALGARVAVVDIARDKLEYARAQGADAVIDASCGNAAEQVREVTGGGAHVAIEALGTEATTLGAMGALRKFGRMVQIGMPAGAHCAMTLPMDMVYARQLVIYGTRGMPAWRYPDMLNLVAGGGVDLSPLVTRRITLSEASKEIAAFDAPAPPGVAVITDFQS